MHTLKCTSQGTWTCTQLTHTGRYIFTLSAACKSGTKCTANCKWISAAFRIHFFFRSKGGGCSCLVSRVQGGSFAAAAHQTRSSTLSTALTAPCNIICVNNFSWSCPLRSQCVRGVTSRQSVSHTSEKRAAATTKPGSVDLNRSGCNSGHMPCATFMGMPLWQEMPSAVRSSTKP